MRDWAVWQARAGCYSQAALSSNDLKTLYSGRSNRIGFTTLNGRHHHTAQKGVGIGPHLCILALQNLYDSSTSSTPYPKLRSAVPPPTRDHETPSLPPSHPRFFGLIFNRTVISLICRLRRRRRSCHSNLLTLSALTVAGFSLVAFQSQERLRL